MGHACGSCSLLQPDLRYENVVDERSRTLSGRASLRARGRATPCPSGFAEALLLVASIASYAVAASRMAGTSSGRRRSGWRSFPARPSSAGTPSRSSGSSYGSYHVLYGWSAPRVVDHGPFANPLIQSVPSPSPGRVRAPTGSRTPAPAWLEGVVEREHHRLEFGDAFDGRPDEAGVTVAGEPDVVDDSLLFRSVNAASAPWSWSWAISGV